MEIRFKAVAGKVDQAGGVAVRLQDADNYYVARANALEDNVRFYRVVAGKREQLDGANLKVTSGEWHTPGEHLLHQELSFEKPLRHRHFLLPSIPQHSVV